jgi:hypothetical protein
LLLVNKKTSDRQPPEQKKATRSRKKTVAAPTA